MIKLDHGGDGIGRIREIISSNSGSHFTIVFLQGGNDLGKVQTVNAVEGMAKKYANFYKSIAEDYESHTIYAFPVTPVDFSHADTTLKNNEKIDNGSGGTVRRRYKFACELNTQVSSFKISNLKYATGFYNDLNGNNNYVTYDGKHFTKGTAKIVLEKIFAYTNVLSGGKKK